MSFVSVETLTPQTSKMTRALALSIVGSLSNPSKMPGQAYGFSAEHCLTGSKLRLVPGSVCEHCYACKGFYAMPSYQDCDHKRFNSWERPRWVEAMVYLINDDYFRWHDSGDIQSLAHLKAIVEVCKRKPQTRFWMPTREYRLVVQYLRQGGIIPPNLVIRLSAHMVNQAPPSGYGLPTSTVHHGPEPSGHICRANRTPRRLANGQLLRNRKGEVVTGYCGTCRACWDPTVPNVSYPEH